MILYIFGLEAEVSAAFLDWTLKINIASRPRRNATTPESLQLEEARESSVKVHVKLAERFIVGSAEMIVFVFLIETSKTEEKKNENFLLQIGK